MHGAASFGSQMTRSGKIRPQASTNDCCDVVVALACIAGPCMRCPSPDLARVAATRYEGDIKAVDSLTAGGEIGSCT